MITIRDHLPDDLLAITNLFNAIVSNGTSFMSEETLSVAAMSSTIALMRYTAVALKDNVVIGCYWIHDNMPGRGSHIANATYCVGLSHRNQGIGRALAEHSLASARIMGYRGMQFNGVVCTNAPSVHLWESLGFIRVGIIPGGFRASNEQYQDIAIYYGAL